MHNLNNITTLDLVEKFNFGDRRGEFTLWIAVGGVEVGRDTDCTDAGLGGTARSSDVPAGGSSCWGGVE